MVIRISDKTQNYSKVTKLLVKPNVIPRFKFSSSSTTSIPGIAYAPLFINYIYQLGDDSHLYRDATEKVVSLVSQGVKYVQKCSLIIKYC